MYSVVSRSRRSRGQALLDRGAVIDEGCVIPYDTSIGVEPEPNRPRCRVTDNGVALLTHDMPRHRVHFGA